MLVHSALTNVNITTFDFNNALVNFEINELRLINAVEVLFILSSC